MVRVTDVCRFCYIRSGVPYDGILVDGELEAAADCNLDTGSNPVLSGMYLASESKEKSVFSFLIVLACCCFIPYVFDFAHEGEIRWLKLIHSFSVLLICGTGYYLSRCLPACINRSIEWCGEHSLELYVCHEAIYTFVYKVNGAA